MASDEPRERKQMKSSSTQPPFNLSRRRFIAAATLLAASGLPDWFIERGRGAEHLGTRIAPNQKPGIGLIGCGTRGTVIARLAVLVGEGVAVCAVDAKRLAD